MTIELVEDLVTVKVSNQEPKKESGYRRNGRVWTRSSDFCGWKSGVEYCGARCARLQTLDDAVEFRHDTQGADNSYESQHTGTLIAYVGDGEAGLRAHIYEPSAEELLNIAAKVSGVRFLDVAKDSDLGKQILKFSDSTGRTFVVPGSDISLSVEADHDGYSVYGANDIVRKLMPRNVAKNAAVIRRNKFTTGRVWFYRSELPKNTVRILPVVLGDCERDGLNIIVGNYFNEANGRARGLVHTDA